MLFERYTLLLSIENERRKLGHNAEVRRRIQVLA